MKTHKEIKERIARLIKRRRRYRWLVDESAKNIKNKESLKVHQQSLYHEMDVFTGQINILKWIIKKSNR